MTWQRIYQGVTHNLFNVQWSIIKVLTFNLWTCIFLASLLLRSLLLTNRNCNHFFTLLRLLSACLLLGGEEHNHALALELRHLLHLTIILPYAGLLTTASSYTSRRSTRRRLRPSR